MYIYVVLIYLITPASLLSLSMILKGLASLFTLLLCAILLVLVPTGLETRSVDNFKNTVLVQTACEEKSALDITRVKLLN